MVFPIVLLLLTPPATAPSRRSCCQSVGVVAWFNRHSEDLRGRRCSAAIFSHPRQQGGAKICGWTGIVALDVLMWACLRAFVFPPWCCVDACWRAVVVRYSRTIFTCSTGPLFSHCIACFLLWVAA